MKQKTYTLSEICDFQNGYSFRSNEYQGTPESAYDVFRMGNIARGGGINFNANHAYINKNKCEGLERFLLEKNDLVMCMTDMKSSMALLGHTALIPVGGQYILNQRVGRLRVKDESIADIRYLYYFTNLDEHIQSLRSRANSGVQVNLTTSGILESVITLPPLSEQRAIAGILGALDDKIELNRRMNATLESMARAVFHQWFVENEEAQDWKEKSLDEIANFLNGLALQNFPPEGNAFLPVIKIAQLRKNDTEGADKASTNIPSQYVVEDGDILFSWSGSLEVVVWCGGKGALNQHLFKVTSEQYPKWFYCFWTKYHLADFQEIAAGKATTMGHIQRHHLSDAKVLVPDGRRLREMDKFMSPLLDKIIVTNLESRTLANLRDSLLPKLMRGEVKVKELSE